MANTLTIVDVGHGNCALIDVGDRYSLVDVGPGSHVLNVLDQRRISTIEHVVLSHADEDHIRGLIGILGSGEFTVRNVWHNPDANRSSDTWDAIAWELDDAYHKHMLQIHRDLMAGVTIDLGDDVMIEVLAPRPGLTVRGPGSPDRDGRMIETNTISAVVRIVSHGSSRVLLPADVDELGLTHLLENEADKLQAPVLVFPHHGGNATRRGNEAVNRRFVSTLIDRVQPDLVVFSLGRTVHSNPRPEIAGSIKEAHIMCTQLSRTCAPQVPSVEMAHLSGTYAAGRTSKSCCAGSITIELDATVDYSKSAHARFVQNFVPGALCRRSTIPVARPPTA